MARQSASLVLVSALLIMHLVMAPFTHAEAIPASDADCAGMAHVQGPTAMDAGASDCAQMASDADRDCRHNGHHCRAHALCSCPCAHTPVLSAMRPLFLPSTPPSAVIGVLAAPAFDPPLFKLLRPPK
jgi:hypothetical protein